jgi:hypothetical protein
MWDLWWTEWHWGRFSLSISIFYANLTTDCSTLIIVQGWNSLPAEASIVVDSVPLHPKKEIHYHNV